jgi:ribosome recycling factor
MMEASFGQAENNIIYGKAYDQKKTEAIIKAITDANIELSALIAMIGGSQIMTQGTPPDATNR